MTILQRIAREPVALSGVVVALYGAAIVFGYIHPTPEQTGALSILGGAVLGALRWLLTPSSEVLVQRRPGDPMPIAGKAAIWRTGRPVNVHITPLPDQED